MSLALQRLFKIIPKNTPILRPQHSATSSESKTSGMPVRKTGNRGETKDQQYPREGAEEDSVVEEAAAVEVVAAEEVGEEAEGEGEARGADGR